MTLTKADIAKKIGDDCGFMKAEASEILEKLLDINQVQTNFRGRRDDLRFRKVVC